MSSMQRLPPPTAGPCSSGRAGSCHGACHGLTFRRAVAVETPLLSGRQYEPACTQRGSLQVQCALSRRRKEETVETLTKQLESSALVFGVRFQNISVKDMQDFRRSLPQQSRLIVCKNTLLKQAVDKSGNGFSELSQAAKGENAWLFVGEEVISESVKAYLDFETKLKERLPREQRAKAKPTDISGGAMDGRFLAYAEVERLKNLPTKAELIATIARLIKQVPTKLAVSIKQVPTKVALGVKALADGDDNKQALVSDIFPKPAAEA